MCILCVSVLKVNNLCSTPPHTLEPSTSTAQGLSTSLGSGSVTSHQSGGENGNGASNGGGHEGTNGVLNNTGSLSRVSVCVQFTFSLFKSFFRSLSRNQLSWAEINE
jgi:hypothetical protein